MNSRAEVTTRYAKACVRAAKGDKGRILGEVVGVTGWWQAGCEGGQCGKYLVASMSRQLDGLERHGELDDGVDRYSSAVRAALLALSASSIDRYLKPALPLSATVSFSDVAGHVLAYSSTRAAAVER